MRLKCSIGIAIVLLSAACASAQTKDSLTIGNTTFDFAAPAPPLNAAEQAFFQKYRDAINARNESELLALQDAAIKSCKYDGRQFLLKNLRYTIPANAKVRLFPVKADLVKAFGLGEMVYMPVTPTAVLAIEYQNATKDHVSVVQIMQAVRESGDTIALAPYCLTEKGEQLRKEKMQSQ
jgi:hypothetical protein